MKFCKVQHLTFINCWISIEIPQEHCDTDNGAECCK